jgi:hypothetical protein
MFERYDQKARRVIFFAPKRASTVAPISKRSTFCSA